MPGTTPAHFQNAPADTPARALGTNVNGTAGNNNARLDGATDVAAADEDPEPGVGARV